MIERIIEALANLGPIGLICCVVAGLSGGFFFYMMRR